MKARRRSLCGRWCWRLILLIAAVLISAEATLRLAPGLLPTWYRAQFPVFGIEFEQPGILGRTPVDGYPIPGPQSRYDGPPPAGLVDSTPLLDPAVNPDPERCPRLVLDVDERGFPNSSVPKRADILFVGDSFTLLAGARQPPGLQRRLAEATGWTIYNLGVAGMGPRRERWLLESYGLPLQPRAVVWFFFGGNDLADIEKLHAVPDAASHADLPGYTPPPKLRVVDLLVRFVQHVASRKSPRPPLRTGVHLPRGPDAGIDFWLSPYFLRVLAIDREAWLRRPGLELALTELRAAKATLAEHGIPLLLVYLPSKPEVVLPFVADQLDAIATMAAFDLGEDPPMSNAEFLAAALANRGALEGLVTEFAIRQSLPLVSATPCLTAQTANGRLGYYCADTHWNEAGQAALLPELQQALRKLGVK